ncbi:MAG: VOC family protein [Thermomicrobiales bacterium]
MAQVLGPDFIVLYVRDIAAARQFYTERLGLAIEQRFTRPDFVTFATRPILFGIRQAAPDAAAAPAGPGMDLWLNCDDVEALHTALAGAGTPIVRPPEDTPFGRRFVCRDPDGYVLTIYQAIPLDQVRP